MDSNQDYVGYLENEPGKEFLCSLVQEYDELAREYSFDFSGHLFCYEQGQWEEVKKWYDDFQENQVYQWIQNIVRTPKPRPDSTRAMLQLALSISQAYADYKKEPTPTKFKTVFQTFADFSNEISRHDLSSQVVSTFVVNLLFRGGYFDFPVSHGHFLIKSLRNIRAHNNIVLDRSTWKNLRSEFMKILVNGRCTRKEAKKLKSDVKNHKKVVMFDKNTSGKKLSLHIVEPRQFLKHLVTLCHVQLFVLGYNDILIFSRELWRQLQDKYDIHDSWKIKEMKATTMQDYFHIEDSSDSESL